MNTWRQLKRFTQARVALGRAGSSLPTEALLDFELAHAKARDAVHAKLNVNGIERELAALGLASMRVHSAARDRAEYLRRPDQGRTLEVSEPVARCPDPLELLVVIADGLSAAAAERHACPIIRLLQPKLTSWQVGPVIIAEQARVALGDELGERFGARIVVVIIGERPGLSSPDSLGIYLTYDPRPGRSDAERNCISNIRPEGLRYEVAAYRLYHLLESARRLRLSGVGLKDQSQQTPAILT